MQHGDVILTLQWRHWTTCNQRAAVRFLSFPRAGTGMWKLSHMGKNNRNPNLVCEKSLSFLYLLIWAVAAHRCYKYQYLLCWPYIFFLLLFFYFPLSFSSIFGWEMRKLNSEFPRSYIKPCKSWHFKKDNIINSLPSSAVYWEPLQTVWTQIRPKKKLGLIWIQTV